MAAYEGALSVLDREVRYLKGVGPHRAEVLSKLGLSTVRDVLYHLPRSYEDRRNLVRIRDLKVGQKAVVAGEISSVGFRPGRGGRWGRRGRGGPGVLTVTITDDTGALRLVWFNARSAWQNSFPVGKALTAYGEAGFYDGKVQMAVPTCEVGVGPEESEDFGQILPIYPLTEGISQNMMRKVTRAALEVGAYQVPDLFPERFRVEKGFPAIGDALRHAHYPQEMDGTDRARRRLSYEELLVFQSACAIRRTMVRHTPGIAFRLGPNVDRRIRRLFPFTFTAAQDRVIGELAADMRADRPMNRLLQGDVGCGKTVVALYALLGALAEGSKGYQVALMAPTEVLAEQHYLTLQSVLERARVRTMLLSRSTTGAERAENLRRIADGEVDLVVGTHALIQGDVEFRNLALLVIDEQHRFGVRQRLALKGKGPSPDCLIMTATPIPRTLALACFGDMDISVIDEMPPGRAGVETELLPPRKWKGAFRAALGELEAGRRAFVIYPLVEESEKVDLQSATEGFEELGAGIFSGVRCCLLHGQMSAERKRRAMEAFRTGECRVMVATTVVEVGIDVPEATVMIIQHAERLGLAQLHQLRGRIGRGEHRGRCFLLAKPTTQEAAERLEALTDTCDGFRIAEADLRIRGPGQFFGTQQSGMPEFKCYDFADTELLAEAREDAFKLVASDPGLKAPKHALLREAVLRQYAPRLELGGAG